MYFLSEHVVNKVRLVCLRVCLFKSPCGKRWRRRKRAWGRGEHIQYSKRADQMLEFHYGELNSRLLCVVVYWVMYLCTGGARV